ncbi:LCP family protein required for cell wall assembly [Thermocatellispora tengchongensis]|uniref:LCP family protein required for cell wall assembly n=1 Tax=Thermocatellispora tengchongensis TaxID=1073253 RepID=A0A840NT03_9ACTN|nr:LCP family protein [Thermocatellispora tengchongensis]MBB5130382.1 LCP family protein required for cell wall assembly [Thermocatellispora tengchongensis]
MAGSGRRFGLAAGMALTLGSALVWGLAHLATRRRAAGLTLLAAEALLGLLALLVTAGDRGWLLVLAVQSGWLTGLTTALLALGLGWAGLIVRSWYLVRPADLSRFGRAFGTVVVTALALLVVAPMAYGARLAYVSRGVIASVFDQSPPDGAADDPWEGTKRVNILLLGADAAPGRPGVRTDSMTVATIHVRTGRTVLFGLPRNLMRVPMPAGPARDRFPYGFTGDGPQTPGILNEVFQYAEDHPEIVPHTPAGLRGPSLLKRTVSGILGLPVHYYAMVDMKGFAELIDAMGGVRITVKEPIVYGRDSEGYIPAGTRRLSGEAALWFGRSRTDSDDYARMARQKCLLNAVARQADPATLIRGFDRLARAARRAVATDIPQRLLPALIELAGRVRESNITSLQFVPPLIDTAYPDYDLIKRTVRQTLATERRAGAAGAHPGSGGPSPSPTGGVSLDAVCE